MTLRTDYGGALDTALASAKTAGIAFVTSNLSSISTSMQNAAVQGKKSFTITLPVTFQPDDLKLYGPLWYAYSSGVEYQLGVEEIYNNEVSVELNESDTNALQLDLSFSF